MAPNQLLLLTILSLLSWGNMCWAQLDESKGSVTATGQESSQLVKSKSQGLLSDNEYEDLLWMYEEERLAHDVYVKLAVHWKLRMFDNISSAEQVHFSAIMSLLNKYGADVSMLDKETGTFANSDLQGLYIELVECGKKSLEDAIAVGLRIEELDIADLTKRIERTEKGDVKRVYQSLQRGSRNHMRAFYRQASFRNIDYLPQHLSKKDFDDIIRGEHERGRPRIGRREF